MNERIKKLAAAHLLHVRYSQHRESVVEDHYDFYPEELEEFALQIVRECAGIYEAIDNGCTIKDTDDYLEALHKTFRS
jgi:hypothetical protein